MGVLFLFVDGIGVGEPGEGNPFSRNDLPGFREMAPGGAMTRGAEHVQEEERLYRAVDANLGVKGLPQSGTGQAALFTGENAPKAIGKHFGPFPHSGIKPMLRERSLFRKAGDQERRCHFINAYPEVFFRRSRQRERWTCTTLMSMAAGLDLNGEREVRRGEAVTAGMTQRGWREKLGLDVPVITPEEAAERMLKRMESFDLVLYEYYLTDKAGHGRDAERAREVLVRYGRFLQRLMEEKDNRDTLVLCSDHGNLEDLSAKTHTRNPVPLFVLGPGARQFYAAERITDVTPGILAVLNR